MAVFRAQAALGVLQDMDLHALAIIMVAHFEGGAQDLRQLLVRRVQYLSQFLALGKDALQCFVRQLLKIHADLQN